VRYVLLVGNLHLQTTASVSLSAYHSLAILLRWLAVVTSPDFGPFFAQRLMLHKSQYVGEEKGRKADTGQVEALKISSFIQTKLLLQR
jgi:hypothetical protein